MLADVLPLLLDAQDTPDRTRLGEYLPYEWRTYSYERFFIGGCKASIEVK